MSGDRSRLAAWCIGLSAFAAVAVYALIGAPEQQGKALRHMPSLLAGPP